MYTEDAIINSLNEFNKILEKGIFSEEGRSRIAANNPEQAETLTEIKRDVADAYDDKKSPTLNDKLASINKLKERLRKKEVLLKLTNRNIYQYLLLMTNNLNNKINHALGNTNQNRIGLI